MSAGCSKIQINPVADDVCVWKKENVWGEVMAASVTECSSFLFEKNLAPRSLKPGSADWLIVGRAVQIQSPQLCGSKPNSAQFKHAHAQHTQHTHTKHLKRALLFSSERYRADEGVCVCVYAQEHS